MAKKLSRFPGWQVPTFSYDESKVRHAVKIPGSDIYMSTGYSAQGSMEYIRALLLLYELNIETDFVYSARSNKKEQEAESE